MGEKGVGGREGGLRVGVFGGGGVVRAAAEEFGAVVGCLLREVGDQRIGIANGMGGVLAEYGQRV